MLINGKEISEWGESELLCLIKDKEIKESDRLDFKQVFKIDDGFKDDVCALANSRGGYILYGISEKRDGKKKTGFAESLCGIDDFGIDEYERSIGQTLSSSIEPSRPNFSVKTIPITEKDKCVLLLTIFEGYDKPYFSKQSMRFMLRGNAGNEKMSYSQIYDMFSSHITTQDRLNVFLDRRITFLMDDKNTPIINYSRSPLMAVHYIPLSAISGRPHAFDIRDIRVKCINKKYRETYPWKAAVQKRTNVDGVMFYCATHNEMLSHIQIYRNGSVEFATNYLGNQRVHPKDIALTTVDIAGDILKAINLMEQFLCVISFENVKTHLNINKFDRNSIRSSSIQFQNLNELQQNAKAEISIEIEFIMGE